MPLETDPEALRLYFQFNYIPDPLTAYRAIRKLPAGGWLTYERGDGAAGPLLAAAGARRRARARASRTREAVARVREKFDEAVRIRMIADVPLGAFLSGGIDSSSVVASMALQSPEPIKTFSIGFEESRFNELPYARMVAEKYATEHHEIVVRPDSIGIIQKFVQHFGEPFADSSAIPTFIVSEFAARSRQGGAQRRWRRRAVRRLHQFPAGAALPAAGPHSAAAAPADFVDLRQAAVLRVRQEFPAHDGAAQRRWTATSPSTTRPITCVRACCGPSG